MLMMVANNHSCVLHMWDGKPQKLVTAEGKQKGMKTILEERGINVRGLRK